jgi:hypothetical protein
VQVTQHWQGQHSTPPTLATRKRARWRTIAPTVAELA